MIMLIVNLYLLLCTEQFRSNPKRIRWVKMTLVERMVIRSNLRVAALSYSTQFQFLLLLSIQKLPDIYDIQDEHCKWLLHSSTFHGDMVVNLGENTTGSIENCLLDICGSSSRMNWLQRNLDTSTTLKWNIIGDTRRINFYQHVETSVINKMTVDTSNRTKLVQYYGT